MVMAQLYGVVSIPMIVYVRANIRENCQTFFIIICHGDLVRVKRLTILILHTLKGAI